MSYNGQDYYKKHSKNLYYLNYHRVPVEYPPTPAPHLQLDSSLNYTTTPYSGFESPPYNPPPHSPQFVSEFESTPYNTPLQPFQFESTWYNTSPNYWSHESDLESQVYSTSDKHLSIFKSDLISPPHNNSPHRSEFEFEFESGLDSDSPPNNSSSYSSGLESESPPQETPNTPTSRSQNGLTNCSPCRIHVDNDKISGEEEPEEKVEAGFFECNICRELAKEPVVTTCGHLYCWPCLCYWLNCDSFTNNLCCPVCNGHIIQSMITPIYGQSTSTSSCSSSIINVPPRPRGLRISVV